MNPQSLRILRPVLTSPPQLPSAPQILSPSGQHDKFSEITTACSTELGIPSYAVFHFHTQGTDPQVPFGTSSPCSAVRL